MVNGVYFTVQGWSSGSRVGPDHELMPRNVKRKKNRCRTFYNWLVLFLPGILHRINPFQGERYSVAVNIWAQAPLTTTAPVNFAINDFNACWQLRLVLKLTDLNRPLTKAIDLTPSARFTARWPIKPEPTSIPDFQPG